MFSQYGGVFDAWSRWFDLHPTSWIQSMRPLAYQWYTRQPASKPIYRLEPDAMLPGCQVYPREAIQATFASGGALERDFDDSLAWMLALAIAEGFEAIDLFGFPMTAHEEYAAQVSSARYWLGQARGRGIVVTIHGDSALKPSPRLYGYEVLIRDNVRFEIPCVGAV